MLAEFIEANRERILSRAHVHLASKVGDLAKILEPSVHAFLDEVVVELKSKDDEVGDEVAAIGEHVGEQLQGGDAEQTAVALSFNFGAVCDSVSSLAMEEGMTLSARDVRVMNLAIDKAIAAASEACLRGRDASHERHVAEQIGTFSHELRNGLAAAVYAFHAMTRSGLGTSSRTGSVLGRALTRLQQLVDRSLIDVRLGSGVALRLESVRVAHLFLELREVTEGLAAARDVEVNVQAALDAEVKADRQLLESALSNLLHNGIKYTRPATCVTLRCLVEPERVVFEVEDACGGLPPGEADELFRPFVRRSGDHAGVGLGLSLSRRAVEAHGGTIGVRDMPGKGCVFYVELPRAPS